MLAGLGDATGRECQALESLLNENLARLAREPVPHITQQFDRAGYARFPGLLGSAAARFLEAYVLCSAEKGLLSPGDTQVPFTPAKYGDALMETVLDDLCPTVERATGLSLCPTYSYLRVYKSGDILAPHTDRAACEISVSVALGIEARDPWPLFIQARDGTHSIELAPGDAVMYRGIECMHWRDAFDGRYCIQVFFHYVDQAGSNASHIFDRREALATPHR